MEEKNEEKNTNGFVWKQIRLYSTSKKVGDIKW